MNNNQDIFSLCLEDMAASLELVTELENELGNVQNRNTSDLDDLEDQQTKKKPEPRAWAV